MGGGHPGSRNALAAQVGECRDALVRPHPELSGRDLDIVDKERGVTAARQQARDDAAGREHVELAGSHRLYHLETGVELDQIEIDPFPVERAAVEPGEDLAVDGDDVEIAEPQPGSLARDRRRPERRGTER